ncbi:MAG: fumarylacetoacetate hydrolase family protein [Halioglobus sp.]
MQSITVDREAIYPSKVVCIGRNYVEHIAELGNEIPDEPVLFIKPNSALADTLQRSTAEPIHYEAEIAFCVQHGGLAAVGFGLDLTKRGVQSFLKSKGLPWERAKAFDGAAVFSHFVRFGGNMEGLRLELHINGELIQSGGYEHMLHKPDQVKAEIEKSFTLEDGDVVMTGTPKGVGELINGDVFCGKIFDGPLLLVETTWRVG